MVDIAIARCNNDRLQKFQGIPTNQKFFEFPLTDSIRLTSLQIADSLSYPTTHLRLRFAVRIQGSEQGKPSYPFFKENQGDSKPSSQKAGDLMNYWELGHYQLRIRQAIFIFTTWLPLKSCGSICPKLYNKQPVTHKKCS